jgi:hypothetical protein
MRTQLLPVQHYFADAACWLLRRGAGRQSGHSQVMILREPTLHFRRKPIEPTRRGTFPSFVFHTSLTQHWLAVAALLVFPPIH